VKERLKLVESFDELRAGMVIVTRITRVRGMLLRLWPRGAWEPTDNVPEDGWEFAPTPAGYGPRVKGMVCPSTVADRNVYRVEDGLEDTQQTTERTPRKRTARV